MVLVPTHTRGEIRADGKASGEKVEACGKCCRPEPEKQKNKKPTAKDRAACAVCLMTAQLDTAPASTIEPHAPKLLAKAPPAKQERGISLPSAAVYDGRAPPM
jgi:hypothetical protein